MIIEGDKVNLDDGTEVSLYSKEAYLELSKLWTKVSFNHRDHMLSWMGKEFIQNPHDVLMTSEAVFDLKPDVILELGVHCGGGTLFLATLLEAIGKGKVMGVDIQLNHVRNNGAANHPLAKKRIQWLEGSSTAPETFSRVKEFVCEARRKIFILDSDHSTKHVKNELDLYSPLLKKGDMMIVCDTIIPELRKVGKGIPGDWGKGDPKEALDLFLEDHSEFSIARRYQRMGCTFFPGGLLMKNK